MMSNRQLLKLAIKKNHPNTRCTIVDGVITRWGDIINPTEAEKPDEATLIEGFRVEGDLLDAKANWEANMRDTDIEMPRSTEDIYDALDEDAQGRVVQITRDRITAKKTLRGEKP